MLTMHSNIYLNEITVRNENQCQSDLHRVAKVSPNLQVIVDLTWRALILRYAIEVEAKPNITRRDFRDFASEFLSKARLQASWLR